MKRCHIHSRLAGGAAGLLALYGANYFMTPGLVGEARLEVWCRPRGHGEFQAQLWQQGGAAAARRYDMVDRLLACGALDGHAARQVEVLLGPPDLRNQDQAGELASFYYWLGDQRAHPAKSAWFPGRFGNQDRWLLELQFHQGKVRRARVTFT